MPDAIKTLIRFGPLRLNLTNASIISIIGPCSNRPFLHADGKMQLSRGQFEPHELDALLLSRRVYGETRWPDDVPGGATPGHLFTAGNPSDQRDVRDFLQTMLAFTFEGFFVQEDGSVIIWVADEVVEIRTRTPDLLTQPRDIVRTLGISEF